MLIISWCLHSCSTSDYRHCLPTVTALQVTVQATPLGTPMLEFHHFPSRLCVQLNQQGVHGFLSRPCLLCIFLFLGLWRCLSLHLYPNHWRCHRQGLDCRRCSLYIRCQVGHTQSQFGWEIKGGAGAKGALSVCTQVSIQWGSVGEVLHALSDALCHCWPTSIVRLQLLQGTCRKFKPHVFFIACLEWSIFF